VEVTTDRTRRESLWCSFFPSTLCIVGQNSCLKSSLVFSLLFQLNPTPSRFGFLQAYFCLSMIEMDRLSQAQLMLDSMTAHFFTTVGVIQRDAPAVPVNTQHDFSTDPLGVQVKLMSEQLVKAMQAFDSLLDSLPSRDEEQAQLQEIQALKIEHERVSEQLRVTLRAAEERATRVRDALLLISSDRLSTVSQNIS